MEWTKEQKQAIDIRDGKILVAAGAGSGKTAVLVQRIINKVIEEKVDIDRLLVVTFTKAAASEMRERILKAIYQNLEEHPELERQILLLNKATITTIDAFCNQIIKDNFFDESINLDPNFKVAENTENQLLKLEALDEIMEELYEEGSEVVELYSTNKSDKDFRDIILSIYTFIGSNPYPLKWLDDKCELYNIDSDDFAKTIWGTELVHIAKRTITSTLECIEDKLEELYKIGGLAKYCGFLEYDVAFLKECKLYNTWDEFFNKLSEYDPPRWGADKEADPELTIKIKAFKEARKKEIQRLSKEIFVAESEDIFKDIKYSYTTIKSICDVVKRFDERFKKKKQDKNLIDFSDMEHLCFELLTKNESIANHYKEKYEEILVDEYQDSNLMQEYILNAISRGNIFMVGDVKQSIYRFRQACPELFLDKYSTYKNADEGGHQRKILLFKNFRSNENIIDQCNFIFSNIMSKEIGEVRYDEEEYLKFGADYYENIGAKAELHYIGKSGDVDEEATEEGTDEDSDDEASVEDVDTDVALEARLVAKRIKEIVGTQDVYDKNLKQTRKATYKDIAILSRAVSGGVATAFVEELSLRGIPIFADVGGEYFNKVEVQVIMSLLKIIDNPYQDIPLVAVLRSKIGDFSGDELAEIRLTNRKVSFYEAMKFKAGQGDKKVLEFLDRLSIWREKSKYLNLGELLWMLYNETAYYEYVSCMPNGLQRRANLDSLLDKAEKFDSTSYRGLFSFIRFMDNLKNSTKDNGGAISLGENDDVVRLMTMHKSKGLEFPIVFLVNMGKEFNKKDSTKKLVLHKEHGMALQIVNLEDRVKYTSLPKMAINKKINSEQLSEEMRILYVAFTRAREKLIITSSKIDFDKLAKWGDSTNGMFGLTSAKSFIEWISRAVLICGGKDQFELYKWEYDKVLNLFKDEEESVKTFSENIENIFSATPEYKNIEESFNWKYQYDNSTKLPSKITVTELKRLWNESSNDEEKSNEELINAPEFMTKEKRSGATFGTILHNIMQRFDFDNPDIDNMIANVDKIYRASIAPYLEQFLHTNLYEEIKSAKNVWREMPFNLSLKLSEVYDVKDESKDDEILVQGVIDLYFENQDGTITLVDYKTDNLDKPSDFIEKYKVQLDYYKKALEMLTNKKVEDVIIYSFKLNQEIKL